MAQQSMRREAPGLRAQSSCYSAATALSFLRSISRGCADSFVSCSSAAALLSFLRAIPRGCLGSIFSCSKAAAALPFLKEISRGCKGRMKFSPAFLQYCRDAPAHLFQRTLRRRQCQVIICYRVAFQALIPKSSIQTMSEIMRPKARGLARHGVLPTLLVRGVLSCRSAFFSNRSLSGSYSRGKTISGGCQNSVKPVVAQLYTVNLCLVSVRYENLLTEICNCSSKIRI